MTGTVLHVLHRWGTPSERFVRDVVVPSCGLPPIVVSAEATPGTACDHPLRTIGDLRRGSAGAKRAGLVALAFAVRHRARLVHCHMVHELRLAHRVARLARRPLIVSLHGRDLLVEVGEAELRLLATAAAVIVPSPFLAREAVRRGLSSSRIAVIPSGVDLTELPCRPRPCPAGEPAQLVFLGRFVAKKGPVDLARALVDVRSRHPDRAFRITFVGSGPLEADLRTAIQPLGTAAEIVDGTSRAEVLDRLDRAHLLVSPSRTAADGDAETLLVANLEAQALGIPVLTTEHGGVATGLAPGAALVVAEGDHEALVEGLSTMLADRYRWPAMGQLGRCWVEQHRTVAHTRQRHELLYHAVLEGRALPASLARPSC